MEPAILLIFLYYLSFYSYCTLTIKDPQYNGIRMELLLNEGATAHVQQNSKTTVFARSDAAATKSFMPVCPR